MQSRLLLSLLFALATIATGETQEKQTVVFVCEHGSAKSVIAAAHFNRIADRKACHTAPSAGEFIRMLRFR